MTRLDIQNLLNSVSEGDVIELPAETIIIDQRLTFPNKKFTLKGQGKSSTILESNLSTEIINMGTSGARITGIGFKITNSSGTAILTRKKGWRIDHCDFVNTTTAILSAVQAAGQPGEGCPVGLIDNCTMNNMRVLVLGNMALMANDIWFETLGLGTNNAVFVEDCEFRYTIFSNAIDSNYGGRYVFRHNKVYDAYIEAHSVQANNRAARSWEIYENDIYQLNRSMWVPMFYRGGTGVCFNNNVHGTWSDGRIALDNVRCGTAAGDGGLCNGSSTWDGNTLTNGSPCRDQIGQSKDAWLWVNNNNIPPQETDPAYFWNNKLNGNSMVPFIHNNCGAWIKEGVNYFNTIKTNYTPYTYPHPMREEQEENNMVEKIFTIENLGNSELSLLQIPRISITGDGSFTVDETGIVSPIPAGGNTTFKVVFNPATLGVKTATLSIANSDDDENPYIILVTGNGIMKQEINIKVDGVDIPNSGTVDFGNVVIA